MIQCSQEPYICEQVILFAPKLFAQGYCCSARLRSESSNRQTNQQTNNQPHKETTKESTKQRNYQTTKQPNSKQPNNKKQAKQPPKQQQTKPFTTTTSQPRPPTHPLSPNTLRRTLPSVRSLGSSQGSLSQNRFGAQTFALNETSAKQPS